MKRCQERPCRSPAFLHVSVLFITRKDEEGANLVEYFQTVAAFLSGAKHVLLHSFFFVIVDVVCLLFNFFIMWVYIVQSIIFFFNLLLRCLLFMASNVDSVDLWARYF